MTKQHQSVKELSKMIRACVAILAAAIVRCNAHGYHSFEENHHPESDDSNLSDTTHNTDLPSIYSHSETNLRYEPLESRTQGAKPKSGASKPFTSKYGPPSASKISQTSIQQHEKNNLRHTERRLSKLARYPKTKIPRSRYAIPNDTINKEHFTDQEYAKVDEELNRKHQAPTSKKENLNFEPEYIASQTPYTDYHVLEAKYERPRTLPKHELTIDEEAESIEVPQGNFFETVIDSEFRHGITKSTHELPTILDTVYGASKGLNDNTPKPRSLEENYDPMHSVDTTNGVSRKEENVRTATKTDPSFRTINNHYISQDNLRINSNKYSFSASKIYSEPVTKVISNNGLYNRYITPKVSQNSDVRTKSLSDSFDEHASIALKHTARPDDQQFEDFIPQNFKKGSSDGYTIGDFDQIHFDDYDQNYFSRNENNYDLSLNSAILDGFGMAKESRTDYVVPGIEPTSLQIPEVVAAGSSPGLTGVTQAILRKYASAAEPKNKHTSRSTRPIQRIRNLTREHNNGGGTSRTQENDRQRSSQPRKGYSPHRTRTSPARKKQEYAQNEEFYNHPHERNADVEDDIPAMYRFEYAVSDYGSESQFGHKESRQHERAKGSYHVLLPDGRKQIVEYEADENGFKPTITYEEPEYLKSGYDSEGNVRAGYDDNKHNEYDKNNLINSLPINYESIVKNNEYTNVKRNKNTFTHKDDANVDYGENLYSSQDNYDGTVSEQSGDFGYKFIEKDGSTY